MLMELAIMKKICHALITMCFLATAPTFASYGKHGTLSFTPAFSIGLHKRTLSGTVTSLKKYLGNSPNGGENATATFENLVRSFVNAPFGNGIGTTSTDASCSDGSPCKLAQTEGPYSVYPMPGLTYVDQDLTHKTILDPINHTRPEATPQDGILGSDLYFIDSTSAENGEYLLPAYNLGNVSETGTELSLYTILGDGLNHNYVTDFSSNGIATKATNDDDFAEYATDGAGVMKLRLTPKITDGGDAVTLSPKKYSQPTSPTERYYIVLVGKKDYSEITDRDPIEDDAENNYRFLTTDTLLDASQLAVANDAYTQKDFEQVSYYGIDIGVNTSYSVTDFLSIGGYLGLSAPMEKVEHSGRFMVFKPEIEINGRAGVVLGNANGSIGVMFGLTHERFSTTLKVQELISKGNNNYAEFSTRKESHSEFYQHTSIVANIKVTDQVEAYFSTQISEQDAKVEIKEFSQAQLINQVFAIGVTLNI